MNKKTAEHKITLDGAELVLSLKERDASEMKATTTEEGIMTFYASVFGNVDSYGDIMQRGAFAGAIEAFKMNGKYPKVVWNHNWDEPLGKTIDMVEDDYGLKMTVQFNFDVQRARELWSLYKQGALTDFSFGFRVLADDYDSEGHRLIKEVRLYEVSPVLIGANERTHVTHMKSEENPEATPDAPADETTTPPLPQPDTEPENGGNGDELPPDTGGGEDESKAGRVLSGKNRTLVENAVQALTAMKETIAGVSESITALEALLDATEASDPKGTDESEVDQHKRDGLTLVLRNAQRAVKANTAMIVQLKKQISNNK